MSGQPWGPNTLDNVTATGDLKQLFPSFVTAGSGSTAMGTLRRKSTEGVLYRIDIDPSDAVGGYFELWDLAGRPYGASNNIDTGTVLTDAYLLAEQTAGRARLIWRVDFKGDPGLANKTFATRVPFTFGLVGRYVNPFDAVGTKEIYVNIVAEGGYSKYSISG
jgi:hypothetical protein